MPSADPRITRFLNDQGITTPEQAEHVLRRNGVEIDSHFIIRMRSDHVNHRDGDRLVHACIDFLCDEWDYGFVEVKGCHDNIRR